MPRPAARMLCGVLVVAITFSCEPFVGFVHAQEFEGQLRGTRNLQSAHGIRDSLRTQPTNSGQTRTIFAVVGDESSQGGIFGAPGFLKWLQSADWRVLRSETPLKWDFEGHLVRSERVGVETVDFAYDVDGIRTSKSVIGTSFTKFVVDKNRDYAQVLEERDAVNAVQVAYIYGDDLISQERGGAFSFYHYDGQLSTRQLTDAAATVTDSYTFDAFGVSLASSGSTVNNYLYTGEQHDPSLGFYYLRARYLNQSVGRFASQDPQSGFREDPRTLHRYTYAGADSVNGRDPSGAFTLVEMLGAVLVLTILLSLESSTYHPDPEPDMAIRVRPVIIAGSGWSEGAVSAQIARASSAWTKTAKIKGSSD